MARTTAEIVAEIAYVENQLSPENLSWDGERSRIQIFVARENLMERMVNLLAELQNVQRVKFKLVED